VEEGLMIYPGSGMALDRAVPHLPGLPPNNRRVRVTLVIEYLLLAFPYITFGYAMIALALLAAIVFEEL
jgi:hypothetical protein